MLEPARQLLREGQRSYEFRRSSDIHSPGTAVDSVGWSKYSAKDFDNPRAPDYLTDPISTAQDLFKASQQADKLDNSGQHTLAKSIRTRISESQLLVLGAQLPKHKLECVSLAEQLRAVSWRLVGADSSKAIELSRKAADMYIKDLGPRKQTADALFNHGQICLAANQPRRALVAFAQAKDIYDKEVMCIDPANLASFYECYGDALDQCQQPSAACYSKAATIRRSLSGATH
jgi:hypothetical protein